MTSSKKRERRLIRRRLRQEERPDDKTTTTTTNNNNTKIVNTTTTKTELQAKFLLPPSLPSSSDGAVDVADADASPIVGVIVAIVAVLVLPLIFSRNVNKDTTAFFFFLSSSSSSSSTSSPVFILMATIILLVIVVVVRNKGLWKEKGIVNNNRNKTISSLLEISKNNNKIKDDEDEDDDDDELLTIQPLGLRPFTFETVCTGGGISDLYMEDNKNSNEDNDYHIEHEHEPIIVLGKSKQIRKKLAEWLPYSLKYTSNMNLIYSTNIHGRSLTMLYNQIRKTSSHHTIILLEVLSSTCHTQQQKQSHSQKQQKQRLVVGMYASQLWHPSSKVYGDGRCFLFRIVEEIVDIVDVDDNEDEHTDNDNNNNNNKLITADCWKWKPPPPSSSPSSTSSTTSNYNNNNTNANANANANTITEAALWETFQQSNLNSLSMGINKNGYGTGLKLNYDLTKGESYTAIGFNNPPLVNNKKDIGEIELIKSTSDDDCGDSDNNISNGVIFEVGLMEVYQLVREMDGVPIRS